MLDLRYRGNDAIIRPASQGKYPRMEVDNVKPVVNAALGKIDTILWRYLISKARGIRKREDDVVRFPKRPHVTPRYSRMNAGHLLVDEASKVPKGRRLAIVIERLVERGRGKVERESESNLVKKSSEKLVRNLRSTKKRRIEEVEETGSEENDAKTEIMADSPSEEFIGFRSLQKDENGGWSTGCGSTSLGEKRPEKQVGESVNFDNIRPETNVPEVAE